LENGFSLSKSWVWIIIIAVLAAGITGSYLVIRAQQQRTVAKEVDPNEMMALIREGTRVGVYFYSPT
jgi:hypothetical protein